MPNYTGRQSRVLQVKNQEIIIPPNTLVVANLMALQTHPRYWGQDSLTWRPSRWILGSEKEGRGDLDNRFDNETLLKLEKRTFIAWSEGARSCLGKKFAQVEFVAAMGGGEIKLPEMLLSTKLFIIIFSKPENYISRFLCHVASSR